MTIVIAHTIEIDLGRNALVIGWDEEIDIGPPGETDATIDIGQRGTLLGIEIGTHWVQVADSPLAMDGVIRSTPVRVRLENGQVTLPRRGSDYSIAWPGGNQCWRQRVGSGTVETCARIVTS